MDLFKACFFQAKELFWKFLQQKRRCFLARRKGWRNS